MFPHSIDAPFGASFAAVWDASPLSDAYVGDMAGALATSMKLGQRTGSDLLTIGFAALDYVGHAYGPRSHEVQDTLARLDTTIGRLLAALDQAVGAGRYVVALTSDHGVALLPEQAAAVTGNPGGRVSLNSIGLAVDIALAAEFGRQRYVASVSGTYVYFRPGVLARIQASPAATAAVEAGVRGVAGVERVYWSKELAAKTPTDDPVLTALRRSYFEGRSGDLAFLPRPNWVVATAGSRVVRMSRERLSINPLVNAPAPVRAPGSQVTKPPVPRERAGPCKGAIAASSGPLMPPPCAAE